MSLEYDPYAASVLLRPLKRAPAWSVWAIAIALVVAVVVTCAIAGTLWGTGYSRWTDLRVLVGANPSHPKEHTTDVPLVRDTCALVLLVSLSVTLLCLYYQWKAFAELVVDLDRTGAWRWRAAPEQASGWLARFMTRAVDRMPARDGRTMMEQVIAAYGIPHPRRAAGSVAVAAGAGVLAWLYLNWADVWVAVVSPGRKEPTSKLSELVDEGWWASSQHPAGLVAFIALVTIGVYLVLAQNAVVMSAVNGFAAARRLATFHVDWFNLDGAWGWAACQRMFLLGYVSIALRAVQIAALLVALRIHQLWAVTVVATIWLLFLALYTWYPYRALSAYLEPLRTARLNTLKHEFESQNLSLEKPTPEADVFMREIERVRCANLNPMQLGGWQSWSLVLLVLLPVALTLLQVLT